jgi:hypothetical protein
MNVAVISCVNYLLIVIFGRRVYCHLNAMTALHSSQVKNFTSKALGGVN